MRLLMRPLLAAVRTWWLFGLVLVANFAAFSILFALENVFEREAGIPTFDTQNSLTAALLLEQLPRYSGAARDAYYVFAAFDFVFPLVAALFLAVLWTLLLRTNRWPFTQALLRLGLPLVAFLGTLFDWGENVGLLWVLAADPPPDMGLIEFALTFKALKLGMLTVSGVITVVLLLLAATNWISRVVAHSRHRKSRAVH